MKHILKYIRKLKTRSDAPQEKELSWKTKCLYGMYYQQTEEVADVKKVSRKCLDP